MISIAEARSLRAEGSGAGKGFKLSSPRQCTVSSSKLSITDCIKVKINYIILNKLNSISFLQLIQYLLNKKSRAGEPANFLAAPAPRSQKHQAQTCSGSQALKKINWNVQISTKKNLSTDINCPFKDNFHFNFMIILSIINDHTKYVIIAIKLIDKFNTTHKIFPSVHD